MTGHNTNSILYPLGLLLGLSSFEGISGPYPYSSNQNRIETPPTTFGGSRGLMVSESYLKPEG